MQKSVCEVKIDFDLVLCDCCDDVAVPVKQPFREFATFLIVHFQRNSKVALKLVSAVRALKEPTSVANDQISAIVEREDLLHALCSGR